MCFQSRPMLCDPMEYIACQASLSMGFPRQEHCSGLPFPPPGDSPNPGIELASLASPALAGGFFINEPPGKPENQINNHLLSLYYGLGLCSVL